MKLPRTISVLVIRGLTDSHMSVRNVIYLPEPVTGGETKDLSGPACSAWSCFSFIYMLVKGPVLAQYEATISVIIILVLRVFQLLPFQRGSRVSCPNTEFPLKFMR